MTAKASNWGKQPHRLLELDEAWSAISAELAPGSIETVPLANAVGRTLARAGYAGGDFPPFNKAMMDGFAVRSADCSAAGAKLKIVGLRQAGENQDITLNSGEALRINTGAMLPKGADAVARIEDCTVSNDGADVSIDVAIVAGKHVAPRGSDYASGALLFPKPLEINAARLAALATAGVSDVDVYRQAEVAILTTGNETVSIGAPRAAGQIVDSNGPMLTALVERFDATARPLGIVPDDDAKLKTAMQGALSSDVVLIAGGMSMGTHDLVPNIAEALGVRWIFHGVRIRPGKPVAYGRGPNGQHVFGLPGNPVSAFVCATVFAQMAIRALRGHPIRPPKMLRAHNARRLDPKGDDRPAFLPALVWQDAKGKYWADACAWRGSGDPFGLVMANGLMLRRDPTGVLEAGDGVEVVEIG